MNFFEKLFGKKPKSPVPQQTPPSQPTAEAMRRDPNLVQVFDKYGRELFITKEEWRKNILPGAIKDHWDNADELFDVIVGALNDGFRDDIVDAARRLYEIDTNPERGACIWGIVLKEEKRLDEAEKVLRDYLTRQGESGVILTNLAKVLADRGDNVKAEETLWHALEVDPNQDNGFVWYVAIQQDRGGATAGVDAMRRVAALPGSWRAQAWLARNALENKNLDQAVSLYEESLSRVKDPAPPDLLMQISGDLGNAGHLPEIIRLVEPRFVVEQHGLSVGNNLIKAHLDLGELDAARAILDQLYAKNRPNWNPTLSYWDTEIAKARLNTRPAATQDQMKIGAGILEGPVWLKPSSPAATLFPAKAENSIVVTFLGSTAETATRSEHVERQLSDAPGQMSRALPLFLAEQIEFCSCARTRTLVPWIVKPEGGFVLSSVAWSDDTAVLHAQQGVAASDYVVISHLKTRSEPWTAEVRLVRVKDGKRLGQFEEPLPLSAPADAVFNLVQVLRELFGNEEGFGVRPVPPAYTLPADPGLLAYLLRLENLLATRCSGTDNVAAGLLNGEREILEGNLDLCLQAPYSVSVRLLLAQTLLAMKRVRPDILPLFADRIRLLQKENPLAEPAQDVVQGIIDEALAK